MKHKKSMKGKKRTKGKKNITHKFNKAAGPKSPYSKDGEINTVWIKENGNSHATFVVDPKGTGTYCHVTITYRDDPTKFHYGYELRNPTHRTMGKHFWTTPYANENRFTNSIRTELRRLYNDLCDEDSSLNQGSHLLDNNFTRYHDDRRRDDRQYSYRSRSRSPRRSLRGGKKTKYKNKITCKN